MYDTPDFDKQMNMTPGEKAIERLRNRASFMAEDYHQDIDIVEKELKRLEELEIMYSNCVIEGTKQKKALEIIRNHCSVIQKGILPREKQDLLDEVLSCH